MVIGPRLGRPYKLGLMAFVKTVLQLAEDFQSHYDPGLPFEDQAYFILKQYPWGQVFSFQELLDYSRTEAAEPIKFYRNNQFGEYLYYYFSHNHFFIDVYVWNELNAILHDHNFVGAFMHLKGASLQYEYRCF